MVGIPRGTFYDKCVPIALKASRTHAEMRDIPHRYAQYFKLVRGHHTRWG